MYAAANLKQARQWPQRELAAKRPVLFLTWGLVVLVGYGALWLSVRGQHPLHGPAVPAILAVAGLSLVATVHTVWVADRASDVTRRTPAQRGSFFLALAAGGFAADIFIHAVFGGVAGRPQAVLLGAAAPLLVVGLVFVASCAVNGSLDWPRLVVGLWLLGVAAEGAWAGPVTYLAVCALAAGGGILLMAGVEPLLRRS